MTKIPKFGESFLAIDIGSINTRATLFDVVDCAFHYIGTGVSGSTVDSPYNDASEGVIQAVQNLEKVCGRIFVSKDGSEIVTPSDITPGVGVDHLVVTYSAGPPLKTVLFGLLEDVSMESIRKLAHSIPVYVVDEISLNDRRSMEQQLNDLATIKPDLILFSGGTETGATRSVLKMAEMLLFALKVIAKESRPLVLYVGNKIVADQIKEAVEQFTFTLTAPNIRPGIAVENQEPGRIALGNVVSRIRNEQYGGLRFLRNASNVNPMPASHAFGRMIHFLGELYNKRKGVMGIDLGAMTITAAAAKAGVFHLENLPLGVGRKYDEETIQKFAEQIQPWLAFEISVSEIQDYLWQRSINPQSIPVTDESLAVEQAYAKVLLSEMARSLDETWNDFYLNYEPYLVSGAVITQAATAEEKLMMILDGLQPLGVTSIIMDQNGLLTNLGAVARLNALLPVQLLESGAFVNLGTVISPISHAADGRKIITVNIRTESGGEEEIEIRKGSIYRLPVSQGQQVEVQLQTHSRTVLDPLMKSRHGRFRMTGGVCGIVIDARGRPVRLPGDAEKRIELLQKWQSFNE